MGSPYGIVAWDWQLVVHLGVLRYIVFYGDHFLCLHQKFVLTLSSVIFVEKPIKLSTR